MSVRYQSLDRGPTVVDHDREFLPIRDRRDRSLDRGLYFEDDPYLYVHLEPVLPSQTFNLLTLVQDQPVNRQRRTSPLSASSNTKTRTFNGIWPI